MRATVLLSADLAAMGVAGRALPDHWAFVCAQAGIAFESADPEAVADAALIVDGRHAALDPAFSGADTAAQAFARIEAFGGLTWQRVGPQGVVLAGEEAPA